MYSFSVSCPPIQKRWPRCRVGIMINKFFYGTNLVYFPWANRLRRLQYFLLTSCWLYCSKVGKKLLLNAIGVKWQMHTGEIEVGLKLQIKLIAAVHTAIEICVQSQEIAQSPLLQRRNYVIQEPSSYFRHITSLHKFVVEVVSFSFTTTTSLDSFQLSRNISLCTPNPTEN